MSQSDRRSISPNKLLSRLSDNDFNRLQPHFEQMDLPLRRQIERVNKTIEHVYFLETGMASVVAVGSQERNIEIGLIGREGCTGLAVILGAGRAPHETFMQMAGSGMRISTNALRDKMEESATLRATLLLFAHCFFVQTAQTALANGRSKLEDRLTRWLLMAHDRAEVDEFPITHEFLSIMLGVRRPGVTVAVNDLQRQGLIRTDRGLVAILDRKGLEESANGSYGVAEAEYARVLQ